MKKIILGFVAGLLTATTIGVLADYMEVNNNPFPILVDGEQKDLSAYNIDGSTYLQLRGVAEALDVNVDFNEKNEIVIGEEKKENSLNKYIPKEIDRFPLSELNQNGRYYAEYGYMRYFLNAYGIDVDWNQANFEFIFKKDNSEIYRYTPDDDFYGILYDNFIDIVLPALGVEFKAELAQ